MNHIYHSIWNEALTTVLNVGGIRDSWVQSYADTGNWFLYSITPVLNITADLQTVTYGTNPAGINYTITGFLDDDTYNTELCLV